MDYALAKKLKDAGFQQTGRGITPDHGSDEASWCYYPTLEELIEACGDDIVYVARDRYSGTYSGAKYLAYGWLSDDYGIDGDDVSCMNFWHSNKDPVGKGATPTEAVARLWLELQRK
jgi:hypothetical protein